MKEIEIVYPFANVMGLFFQEGRLEDGGTCEFATKICLEKCCANAPGAGKRIGFEKKQEIFNYFLNNSPEKIASRILTELKNAKCKIFTWFASGDCPFFLTSKFFAIVEKLDKEGIIQTGFTRNRRLWERCQSSLSENNRTLLTIENIKDASMIGLYSIPDYEIGAIDIVKVNFKKVYKTGGCGGGYYEDHVVEVGKDRSHLKLDCNACYENKTGCFWKTKMSQT